MCAVALMACGAADASSRGTSLDATLDSPAVRTGVIVETGTINLYIYLPPSYETSQDSRYPVIYGLHGFGDDTRQMVTPFATALRSVSGPEAIIVGIQGTNRLGGSFYANSEATGNWEDMIVNEAVAYMDSNYRTEPVASRRMLSGFSMGGFAAWNIGLGHPDVFGSVWSCCPGAWDQNGLRDTLASWDSVYRNAYGAAFSPNLAIAYPHSRVPSLDGTTADNEIVADWEKGFGGIDGKLAAYAARGEGSARLIAIGFAYAASDENPWITRGTPYIAGKMRTAGLPVEASSFPGGHAISTAMIEQSFVPFVQKAFGQ